MHKIKNGIFPLRKRAFRNFSLKALPQNSSLFYCRTLSLPCASITGLIREHRYDTDRGDPSRSLQKIQRIHRHAVLQKLEEHIRAFHRVVLCRLGDIAQKIPLSDIFIFYNRDLF